MAKEKMVYQANPLIEGRREFDLTETRLFYLGLRELVPRLTTKDVSWGSSIMAEFPTVTIPTEELIKLFGSDKYYSTLKGICSELAKKTIEAKSGKEQFTIYPVFAELSYDSSEGLRLEFNPKMKPWLLDLANKPFTKLPFEQIWALSFQKREPYAIRLLELLLQYQNTESRERTLKLEEIKRYLGMPENAYEGRTNTFRQRVIDANVKAINKSTSYKVEYESVKDGRKIIGFKFKLYLPEEMERKKVKEKVQEFTSSVTNMSNFSEMFSMNRALENPRPMENQQSISEGMEPKEQMPLFQEPKQKPLSEVPISEIEAESILNGNEITNGFSAHMKARGLTIKDIAEGKR